MFEEFAQSEIVQALVSETARRVYAWVGLVGGMAFGFWLARRQVDFLHHLRREELDPEPDFRTDDLKTVRGYEARIEKMEAARARLLEQLWIRVGIILGLGILLPGVMLGSVIHAHDWLLPGYTGPLLTAHGGEPSFAETGIFLLDQLLRGALLDVPEVFRLGLSPVENNPSNHAVSVLIVVFRAAAGLSLGGIGYIAWRLRRGLPKLRERIRLYRERIDAMTATS